MKLHFNTRRQHMQVRVQALGRERRRRDSPGAGRGGLRELLPAALEGCANTADRCISPGRTWDGFPEEAASERGLEGYAGV